MNKDTLDTFASIKVCGIGGSGGNPVSRMIAARVRGVEFIAINTDAQALMSNPAPIKVQIGKETTQGLGAGSDTEVGRKSAEENKDEIYEVLKGANMVFVTCGAGGGTGTGASATSNKNHISAFEDLVNLIFIFLGRFAPNLSIATSS